MKNNIELGVYALSVAALAALAACTGGGSGSAETTAVAAVSTSAAAPYAPAPYAAPKSCADGSAPIAAGISKDSVTANTPTDFDASTSPAPTSTVHFSVLMPAHCKADTFPVILHSHGYGGNRLNTIAPDGTLKPMDGHFPSIDSLVQALPHYGYMVISYDQRGHGDSYAANARIIDPAAEVQDARAILDWAYDSLPVQKQDAKTGIAKDFNIGTIGYSYGGGFEFSLAALDSRIDTMVPNGTWNNLLYSLIPGDGVKLSYNGLLCLLAATAKTSALPNTGVHNTPLIASLCNQLGAQGPLASTLRTRADLIKALGSPLAYPRPVTEAELNAFLGSRGSNYFKQQDVAGKSYGFAGNPGPLRQVPTLLLQGNRDVLFNLTEGWRNFSYFGATGADVRLLSTEGGHMNPLAMQKEGTASCGKLQGVNTIMAWFDHYLKGASSTAFSEIPKVCISVADTVGAPDVAAAGLFLDNVPVGSQSGTGGVAAQASSLSASVVLGSAPVFLPVKTIPDAGLVLAGIPRLASISVTPGAGAVQAAVAYMGIGILRAGKLILVDDQVTPFAQGIHASNRGENNHEVDLPGIGEKLQKGDVIGLLLYENHVQYSAVVSTTSAPNLPLAVGYIAGVPIPAVGVGPSLPNPYTVVITGAELPVLAPGVYPGSKLSQ